MNIAIICEIDKISQCDIKTQISIDCREPGYAGTNDGENPMPESELNFQAKHAQGGGFVKGRSANPPGLDPRTAR
jgi:hypothetical protein